MSFPERLHKALAFSQCPKYMPECPLCGFTYVERYKEAQIDSETFKKIPLGKFKLCREGCGSGFYNIAGVTYVACLMLQGSPYFPKDVPVDFFHSKYDDYKCEFCGGAFRLFMPAIEIPAPYVSEFSVVPCLFEALRKRKRSR